MSPIAVMGLDDMRSTAALSSQNDVHSAGTRYHIPSKCWMHAHCPSAFLVPTDFQACQHGVAFCRLVLCLFPWWRKAELIHMDATD